MPEQRSADDIVEVFENHIAQLTTIPVNANGKPNISALARSCGFDRQRFRTNPRLAKALSYAIQEKGLAPLDQAEHEDRRLRQAKNVIKTLRERIDVMHAEIKAKNDRIRELEHALEKESHQGVLSRAADLFLDTGRMPR